MSILLLPGLSADKYRMATDLANFRESKKISLSDIAGETKIAPAALEAIEAGRYHSLPGGVYDVNYIRQYARAIGYDEEALLADYRSKMNPPAEAAPARRPGVMRGLAAISAFLFAPARAKART